MGNLGWRSGLQPGFSLYIELNIDVPAAWRRAIIAN